MKETKKNWLDGNLVQPIAPEKESLAKEILKKIEKEDWLPSQKNLYAGFLYGQLAAQGNEGEEVVEKRLGSWGKNKAFQSYAEEFCQNAIEKFRISGMVCCMTATLVFYFAKAALTGQYVINFSVDAVVGVLALLFLIRNLQVKYRLTGSYSTGRYYMWMDLLTGLLCLLFKIVLPVNLDLSLVVLLIAYFAEKKRFVSEVKDLEEKVLPRLMGKKALEAK